MKVLILDDEFFVRKNILMGIDWDFLGLETPLECDNGEDAIELCRSEEIAILISDIRMAGMSGIECIRQIRTFCPDLRIIFISGYPEKEYLKDAIHLQAFNFIEKPINMTELQQSLQDIILDIKKNNQLQQASFLRLYRNNALLAMELVSSTPNVPRLQQLLGETRFYQDSDPCLACVVRFPADFDSSMEETFLREFNLSCEDFTDVSMRVIAGFRNHLLLIHFSGSFLNNSLYYQKKLKLILQTNVIDPLLTRNLSVRVGIGGIASDISQIHQSYEQACIASQQAFYLPNGNWYRYKNLVTETCTLGDTLLSSLQLTLNTSGPARLMGQLEEIYQELLQKNNTLPATVSQFYCGIGEQLWQWTSQHHYRGFTGFATKYALFNHIQQFLFLRDLQQFFRQQLQEISYQADSYQYGNQTANDMANYIRLHYQDPDLSVQDIADAIHMAPNYLTGLFKRYTGNTVNQYIINLRITRAKALLSTTDMSMAEIAHETGFRDPGYFSKVFYKQTNLSPSDYRRRQT